MPATSGVLVRIALHLAAMRGEFHAAVALVSAAARIRYQTNLLVMLDQDGKTAVDLAEAGGHMQIARLRA